MSNQTIVDVVVNDSTATVVDNRDLSNLTIDLNATGQLLTNNLISSGNYLDSEIAIVSGIAQSGSNESLTGQINQLSGNLITTGQTLQTQITSNDSDINTLTTNLATTGETLTSEINSISGVVPTGGATNQVLAKIDSTDYNTQWVDQSGGGGGSGTVTSSTATTNYLTKWTNGAGEVIGNSILYDNGSNIGIGTASPSSKLHVYGGDAIINTLNIGLGAGSNNSTNTSIGVDSLSNNTIGIQNVAVGYQTLLNNTEGIRNVSVGYQSLYTNTTGDSNISIGYKSLHFNLIGLQNIGIGDFSLFNNTGSSNTAVGFSALKSNTSGNDNSAIGFNSLLNNTTGTRNTAQGFEVLYSNTTGGYNVAIGYKSIYNNTSGTFNVANGYLSLYANTTGSNNVAVGYQAGRFITDGSTANTTGDYNVFLGTDTKALADNDQNEIVIGYNATGLGSNSAVLGNDSITKTVLKGNVGIGTTAPSSKLHVNGMISAGIAGNNSANYAALLVSSTGTGTQQSAIAIQQTYPNGNTIIWADLEPYAEYNFSHNGIENAFTFNSGYYGNQLKSTVIRNRSGAQRISFEKVKIWQNTAQVDVGGAISIGQLGAGGETSPTIRLTIKDLQDSSFNSGIALVRSTNTDTAYINIVGGNLNLNAPTGASTQFKVAGTNTFAIAANGSISSSTGASLSSGGTWTDASTRELKQDIKDLDYRESLNIIKHLNPVKFAYKKDPKNKKIGFIAEDVPDLVATEDRKGLSALQIVSALTKVVQSQQKEIQQLKRMMKRLNKIK